MQRARCATAFILTVLTSLLAVPRAHAVDYYVARAGQASSPNYNTWGTAASNIATVTAMAGGGDTVWVSNGTYVLTSEIAVDGETVRSFNNGSLDRDGTIIDGDGVVRCFTLNSASAVVRGFTITNGYSDGSDGGGVRITAGTLDGCLVIDNLATNASGGGVYATGSGSIITNCDLVRNVASISGTPDKGGGGASLNSAAKLLSSRILYNVSPRYWTGGGGVNAGGGSLIQNCIIASNRLHFTGYGQGTASQTGFCGGGIFANGPNAVTVRNCLILGNGAGANNLDGAAGIAGTGNTGGALIENCTVVGNHWTGIGGASSISDGRINFRVNNTISYYNEIADLYAGVAAGTLGTLIVSNSCASSTNTVTTGSGNTIYPPAFSDRSAGDYRLHPWSLGVDAGLTLGWTSADPDLAGQPRISANNLVDMGAYETTAGPVPFHYVAHSGQTPVSPYTNGWATAASNMHAVLSAAFEGATVLVAPGTYQLTNQLDVGNLTIRSDNGGVVDADNTIIRGAGSAATPITNRCFYLDSYSARVEGLTISNGYIQGASAYSTGVATHGAGVHIVNGTLEDCTVTGNLATNAGGGGIYAIGSMSVITNCRIIANECWWADGAAVGNAGGGGLRLDTGAKVLDSLILNNRSPMYAGGGGAVRAGANTLIANCNIISNTAADAWAAGGIWLGGSGNRIRNCQIMGNDNGRATRGAGIAAVSGADNTIESCTIVDNLGRGLGANNAGGAVYRVWNTIEYDNLYQIYAGPSGQIITSNSCIEVTNNVTAASGTFTNDPQFTDAAAGDYRPDPATSPCIDNGIVQGWMEGWLDLDGNARVDRFGAVDIGAYEFEPPPIGTAIIIQ